MPEPVDGEVRELLRAGERRIAYVRIPAPEGSSRKTSLVTLFDPPETLRLGQAVQVRRGENGWELVA